MPQLSGAGGGGGGGDPELCATDEMIPFKDEGDPQKEKIFAEISHPEEEGDLADIKSSLVNESEIIPASSGHEVSAAGRGPEVRGAQRRREGAGQPGPPPRGVPGWGAGAGAGVGAGRAPGHILGVRVGGCGGVCREVMGQC